MKALSIIQPWASLIVIGAKSLETRSWSTPYRGPLLIHASQKLPTNLQKFKFTHDEFFRDFIQDMEQLPYGAVIGKAELINIYSTDLLTNPNHQDKPLTLSDQEKAFGDYSTGRYAWHLINPVLFDKPIKWKGSLSLWEFPDDQLH
jgi:hypothetical protein